MVYDVAGRLDQKRSSTAVLTDYDYTASGQRARMRDNLDTTARETLYVYDEQNRLAIKNAPEGTLTYGYDTAGNLQSISARKGYTFPTAQPYTLANVTPLTTDPNPNGAYMTYKYDERRRLSKVNDDGSVADVAYSYDPVGSQARMTYRNGMQTAYTYNALNQLTAMNSTFSSSPRASFVYDDSSWTGGRLSNSGRRNRMVETINGGASRQVDYSYDNLNRLTQEKINGSSSTKADYTYDAVGNRLSRTATGINNVTGANYGYTANDWLGTIQNTKVGASFDANGNTTAFDLDGNGTADQTTLDQYDIQNRLVTATRTVGTVNMVYDGDGNRVKKVAGTTTTYYLVAEQNLTGYAQVLEERSALTGDPTVTYVYGLDLVSQKRGGTTRYFGYDGLGTVRYLTTPSGTVDESFTYDAFGILTGSSGTAPDGCYYRYTGEQWDADLGMYYLRARYYKPELGRFWTMDSYEGNGSDPLSLHKYLYCHGDSINGIDPTGHYETLIGLMCAVTIALICSPDIANAPGPNDRTESSWGAADMCINIIGGHLIGKAIGFGFGLLKVGFNKVVNLRIGGRGPIVTVAPTVTSELSPSVVASFRSKIYIKTATTEDMIVYRAEGGTSGKFGRFFGTTKPVNAVDAEELGNVVKWNNECTTLSTYKIPKGTIIYKGGVEGGAGEQVFIPNPIGAGVSLISSESLPLNFIKLFDLIPGSLLE